MIKPLVIGLWACLVTLAASYAGAYWAAGLPPKAKEEPFLAGLEYRRVDPINIPMILDGQIRGYVIAKLVFTADAATLRKLPIEPQIFVTDAAFSEIYTNGRVEFGKLSKYNLAEIMSNIKNNVNAKLNAPVIQEVLVDGLNYIDRTEIRALANRMTQPAEPRAVRQIEPSTH
ncbi:hypothetical protein [Prosthecomicrobium pneumaticum]|uniref:Uncharacterized protein n=1 Tax=Prosthecomicrobium pneumaticum TaxID=81895 RepID=A0A7W9FKP9_9HYPH|nr:hypothetical protein [Prosthecomicrobium pneumaticum]MBB5751049.1 hypothetical protein [Prosthecomicrobium pneumaticum]